MRSSGTSTRKNKMTKPRGIKFLAREQSRESVIIVKMYSEVTHKP